MLATSRCTDCSQHAFLPHVSSPLSPRSANIYGRRPFCMSSADVTREEQKCSPARFSQRPVKKAKVPKQDELKERRRSMFLKKVKEEREERRFEKRGEDLMRLDYMRQQKRWEAEQARDAPQLSSDPVEEEEEYDLPSSSSVMQMSTHGSQQPVPDDEVDEVVQRENEELEALLSYMADEEENSENRDSQSINLWSDEDDYDALFSELVEHGDDTVSEQHQQSVTAQHAYDDEMMDLS